MDDVQQPRPDDLDVSADPGADPHRSRGRLWSLGLVAALVAALVAGPSVASRVASSGPSPAEPYPDVRQVAQEPGLPVPTLTPENANQREGRTADPTPAPTGENANQREGRTSQVTCP